MNLRADSAHAAQDSALHVEAHAVVARDQAVVTRDVFWCRLLSHLSIPRFRL